MGIMIASMDPGGRHAMMLPERLGAWRESGYNSNSSYGHDIKFINFLFSLGKKTAQALESGVITFSASDLKKGYNLTSNLLTGQDFNVIIENGTIKLTIPELLAGDGGDVPYELKLSNVSNGDIYMHYNGKFLTLVVDGVLVLQVKGVSGRPLKDGSFDYSVENQKNKDRGPIPEGIYHVNINEIQQLRLPDAYLGGIVSPITSTLFNRKIGGWPGGIAAWGSMRVWISEEKYGRSGFSIHGGAEPGSAGCIDLTENVRFFLLRLESYNSKYSKVPLIVDYGNK